MESNLFDLKIQKKKKRQGIWLVAQSKNYKNKKEIMKEPEIYDAWTDFINDLI